YEAVMVAAADRAIDSWPVGERFTLHASMQSLTLEVIMRAVCGVDEGPRQEELKRRVRQMLDPVGSRLGVIMMVLSGGRIGGERTRPVADQRRQVEELGYHQIAQRTAAPDLEQRSDVLSLLLLARDEDGQAMTDGE